VAKKKLQEEEFVQPGEFADDAIWRRFSDLLVNPDDPETVELNRCQEICRHGNPFPLVGLQWPSLLLKEESEIELFNRSMKPERFENMTDGIRDACFHPDNPPLRLDWWQKIIIAAFFDISISEIYIKGCTGAGKGGGTSMAVNLWYSVFESSRTTLTSESFEHAQTGIFGEVVMWHERMQFKPKGKVLSDRLVESERHNIIVRNPAKGGGEAFSGTHGPNTLYVFDEATATDDILFENCEKNARKVVALGNPRTLAGRFRGAFSPLGDKLNENGICFGNIGQRLCITVGGLDCINVAEKRLKQPVAPRDGIIVGGTKYDQGQRIKDEHIPLIKELIPSQIDVALFRNNCARTPQEADIYAHGKFPEEDSEFQVVLPSWLDRHEQYWLEVHDSLKIEAFGLDIARTLAGDSTMLAAGGFQGLKKLIEIKSDSVDTICKWVIEEASKLGVNLAWGACPVCIDMGGGHGWGVEEKLRKSGVRTIAFEPSGSSEYPKNYKNLRAEGYALLGRRLNPESDMPLFAMPPDQALRAELCATEKEYIGNDAIQFKIQSKDEIKAKLGRSPDKADALVYLHHAITKLHGYREWMESLKSRSVVLYPTTKEEAVVRKIELEKAPTEWDKVQWDWAPKQINDEPKKIIVTPPDKNPRKPWYTRYLQD
jgi:hypothetical protein